MVRFDDCTTTIINYDANYHLFVSHARDANCFPDQDKKSIAIFFLANIIVGVDSCPSSTSAKYASTKDMF